MRKSLFISILFLSTILFSSCGVMFGGSRYNATIIAKDQPNAEIYANGEKIGVGTATGSFRRNRPLKVELKENAEITFDKSYDYTFRTGNFVVSVLMFGILGLGIDLGTGASYKPDHKFTDDIERKSDKEYTFTIESKKITEETITEGKE